MSKLTAKGEIKRLFSKKYKKNDGTEQIRAILVVKEGEINGYEITKNFETSDQNIIEILKVFKVNQKIECVGYLSCFDGISEKDNKPFAITSINLKEIKLQGPNTGQALTPTSESIIEDTANEAQEQDDDLPF